MATNRGGAGSGEGGWMAACGGSDWSRGGEPDRVKWSPRPM